MSHTIIKHSRAKLPARFYQLLQGLLKESAFVEVQSLTLNFRDPSYSAEQGGYHPVEIRLDREAKDWVLCYATDFAYAGGELEKEIDICFISELVYTSYTGTMPLHRMKSLVRDFIGNFITFYDMGIYQLTITTD